MSEMFLLIHSSRESEVVSLFFLLSETNVNRIYTNFLFLKSTFLQICLISVWLNNRG